MKTTVTLSSNLNCSLFELLNQEIDEVIMTINFYLLLGEQEQTQAQTTNITKAPIRPAAKGQNRVRVNDATATGGWF